jgi:hypothetical protein
MTLSVKDGATWRTIQTVNVNDGGTWRTIQKISVNDGGTWRTVYTALNFSPNVPFAANDSELNPSSPTNSFAYFTLNTDGTCVVGGNDTADGPTQWIYPASGIGSGYEAQVVLSVLNNSGSLSPLYHTYTLLGVSIPYNTTPPYSTSWIALTSNRATTASAYSDNGSPGNISSIVGTVYVRRTGTTTPVTSVTFSVTAEAQS